MRKLVSLIVALVIVVCVFTGVVLTVSASERNWIISPIASTYTTHNDDRSTTNVTGSFTRPQDDPNNPSYTGTKPSNPQDDPNNPSYTGTKPSNPQDDPNNPSYTGTKPVNPQDDPNSPSYTGTTNPYNTNPGKDDPYSPNYTGTRVIVSDHSNYSPDTSASDFNYRILVAVLAVFCVTAVLVTFKVKKRGEIG